MSEEKPAPILREIQKLAFIPEESKHFILQDGFVKECGRKAVGLIPLTSLCNKMIQEFPNGDAEKYKIRYDTWFGSRCYKVDGEEWEFNDSLFLEDLKTWEEKWLREKA